MQIAMASPRKDAIIALGQSPVNGAVATACGMGLAVKDIFLCGVQCAARGKRGGVGFHGRRGRLSPRPAN